MFEKIDFWYFCLYNYFYRNGIPMRTRGGGVVDSKSRACLIFSIIIWSFSLLLRLAYKLFYNNHFIIFFGAKEYAFLFEGLIILCCYYYFYSRYIRSEKYIDLYVKYRDTPYGIQDKIKAIIIILFIIALGSITAFLVLGD